MSDLEHLNMYFDDAMEEIDCHEVLNLWKNESKLTDISQSLKDTFERLLQNSEWREMHLITFFNDKSGNLIALFSSPYHKTYPCLADASRATHCSVTISRT
jgi:hypothetical protein